MLDINYLKQNGVDVDKSLELFGDMEIYNETFEDFIKGIDEKKNNLKRYFDLRDMPNYAIYAHSIKSDARYLGFTEIAKIALDHEMAGKENNEAFVVEHYNELVDATNKMIAIVDKYLNGTPEEQPQVQEQVQPTAPAPVQAPTVKDIILVADDSMLVTNFVIKTLNGKYNVEIAKDGKGVIDFINNPGYHIIGLLLDLNMPNVGGFEVLDYLNQNNLFDKIPTSIITGEDSKDMVNKAFTYGIVDMLVKPFSVNDLTKVVEKTVNR